MLRILLIILSILLFISLPLSISCGSSDKQTRTTTTTQLNYLDPLITGKTWNQMTLNQKIEWVDTALDSMMLGGELKESELQPTIYYVEKLDEVFQYVSNYNSLVAWELTAFTSNSPAITPTPKPSASLKPATTTPSLPIYIHPTYGCSFSYPSGWVVTEYSKNVEIANPNSSEVIFLGIKLDAYESIDYLVSLYIEFLQQQLNVYEPQNKTQIVKTNDGYKTELIYNGQYTGFLAFTEHILFYKKNDIFYVLACKTYVESFPQMSPVFRETIDSFG